ILYRTCGGSMEAIKELIANRTIDQYVRCAAMEALSYAVAFQPALRQEVVHFFQGLFTGEEAESDSCYWGNLAATLCDLHPGESMEILRRAHDAGIIYSGFIAWKDIEDANGKNPETAMERLRPWVTARMPADVHAYIAWFAGFHRQELEQPERKSNKQGKKKTGRTKHKAPKKPHKKKRR
ncbi:MAG: DUF1186 family protein, partial [Betaproteobacteria bacterium]|nr:DUF1186 family protein [Betaproteobacteria bacterium]